MRRRLDEDAQVELPGVGYLVVEPVCERGTEDLYADAGGLGLAVPLERFVPIRVAGAAAGMVAPLDQPGALCPSLGVTVVAGRRHFGAARPWVPRMVGPLYFRILPHYFAPNTRGPP